MLDVEWGTVPSVLSLPVAVWAAYTSHRTRRDNARFALQEQARQVAVSPIHETDGAASAAKVRLRASVVNSSSAPIFGVWLHIDSAYAVEDWSSFKSEVGAGERWDVDEEVLAKTEPFPVSGDSRNRVSTSFSDANGWKWQKWANGELMPPIDARPPLGRAAPLRRLVPGRVRSRWRRRKSRPPLRGRQP